MYYVYIIKTIKDTLYTGIAKNPQKRFNEHLSGKGAKYLRAYKPIEIVWVEAQKDKSTALKREKAIKKLSRKEKEELIINTKIMKIDNI